jgi:hypothetical protein
LQPAGDAPAHQRALPFFFRENLGQRLFDQLFRHPFAAQFADDAGAAVAAGAGPVTGIAEGEAAVVEPPTTCEILKQRLDAGTMKRSPLEFLAKLGGGVGAAGKGTEGILLEGVVAETGRGRAGRARSP